MTSAASASTPDPLDALRAPFPASSIGKLPRITCPACSKKECQQHAKKQCKECGNYISERHMHIDYVGHAEVTDRLLTVDDEWTWRPLAFGEDGLPRVGKTGGDLTLWIELTVAGVTRIGVGTCPANQFEADKVLIGDALRNAAMRFGVALDLWSKSEALESQVAAGHHDETPAEKARAKKDAEATISTDEAEALVLRFSELPDARRKEAKAAFLAAFAVKTPSDLSPAQLDAAHEWITSRAVPEAAVDREPYIKGITEYLAVLPDDGEQRAEYEAFLKEHDIGFPGDPVEQMSDQNLVTVWEWLNAAPEKEAASA